ncbi:hypothetical protein [Microcoleus sp. D2_18a_D3]|uniref:hypothetical protein n=1 Tax=Microcoleus sp. D2_18a_D3 TaxID=3055330 RepID=UPI002FD2F10D
MILAQTKNGNPTALRNVAAGTAEQVIATGLFQQYAAACFVAILLTKVETASS